VTTDDRSADQLIDLLGLRPHPEGGFFVETWRHVPSEGGRGAGSAIYFLLKEGFASARHRVDADEAWHFYAGDPVELTIGEGSQLLGIDFESGERPQLVVPAHEWQSARTLGKWSLVGCTVSPAFEFEGFELDPREEA
jgi:predicted cupin superfamily sugar epimerase